MELKIKDKKREEDSVNIFFKKPSNGRILSYIRTYALLSSKIYGFSKL